MRITELLSEVDQGRRNFLRQMGAAGATAAGLGKAAADPLGDFIKTVDKPDTDPIGSLIDKKLSEKEKENLIQLFSSDSPTSASANTHPVNPGNIKGKSLPPVNTTAKSNIPSKTQASVKPYIQAPNSVPWEQLRDYLSTKMDEQHYVGMMLNIAAESGFRPGVIVIDSNGLPSGGLFQHNGNRFEKLQQSLGPGWRRDWKGQINFALKEPKGQEFLSTKFNNPKEASHWWTINFEVPGDRYNVARKRAKSPDLQRFASNP